MKIHRTCAPVMRARDSRSALAMILLVLCVFASAEAQAQVNTSAKRRTARPAGAVSVQPPSARPPASLPYTSLPLESRLPVMTVGTDASPRIFAYTNGVSAFWCGMVQGPNTSGFHGITRAKLKLFEDIRIFLGDSLLDRSTAVTELTPAGFTRRYSAFNTVERAFFADSLTLLVVTIETAYRGDVMVLPAWNRVYEGGSTSIRGGAFAVTGADAAVPQGAARVEGLADGAWEAPLGRALDRIANPWPAFSPVWYVGTADGAPITISVEFSEGSGITYRSPQDFAALRAAREHRILSHLDAIGFASGTPGAKEIFDWIAASMQSLVMRQSGEGIYAGLPWFDDYWGRDMFITMPGALLATGRFEEARSILETYAARQNTDAASPDEGRIPNRVQPSETIYNTADGTPWFALAAADLVQSSGDTAFARRILPALVRACDGALRHHVDAEGFLTHGDAETWMDAVGPAGPWSPRGNRAIEIQALWHAQLIETARLARITGDTSTASRLLGHADRLRSSFPKRFVDPVSGRLADRITASGERDMRERPNVLLAALVDRGLIADDVRARSVRAALRALVSPAGVMSLAPADPDFHPWHEAPEYYPKDAAYHNGTIWTWLTGSAVTALCHAGLADSAWTLTTRLEHLARTQGAVGTLPECTDAAPRKGADDVAWSGTFSQAWSDAEYLRGMVQDYLGFRAHAVGPRPQIEISPRFPSAWTWAGMNLRAGDARVRVTVQRREGRLIATARHLAGRDSVELIAHWPNDDVEVRDFDGHGMPKRVIHMLAPGDTLAFDVGVFAHAAPGSPVLAPLPQGDAWATVSASQHKRLSGPDIRMTNSGAPLIAELTDPDGDDRGPAGTYTPPRAKVFVPGMFDIRGLTVHADAERAYFTIRMRALTQPGWHPEYGFQLTMLAIAIDEGGPVSAQRRAIGVNSGYTLGHGRGCDKLIVIGGGIRLEDATGRPLAEYIPTDIRYAIGDARDGVISFALPVALLGKPDRNWRFTLVAGAQDDHGGAGIGEFRTVLPAATEWNGGGNATGGPNVYDVLESTE